MKQATIRRTLCRILALVLLGVLLACGIYGIVARLCGNRMPMPFGIGLSVVLSGSMEPELSVDDLIIVRRTRELHQDQVVVYQDEDGLTVHRIVKIEGEQIVTMGDANNTPDAPITPDMVKGEVICAIPRVGSAIGKLRRFAAPLLLIGVAALLLPSLFRKPPHDAAPDDESPCEESEKEK